MDTITRRMDTYMTPESDDALSSEKGRNPCLTALLCFSGSHAQRLLRIYEEAPLKDQKIALLEQRVTKLEKESDLLKQQKAIQERLTELAKREAEVYRTTFEKEKEFTDQALKLAEIRKPKSNWELQGLLGLGAFALGLFIGR
jgi:hypothetical protein